MKKSILNSFLACVLLFCFSSSWSQSYLPMLEDGKEWFLSYSCSQFCGGNWYLRYNLYLDGDSTINGTSYQRMMGRSQITPGPNFGNPGLFGFFREDTLAGHVYTLSECVPGSPVTEQLLFDFSLEVGDTMSNCIDSTILVTNVTSITTLDGVVRRVIEVDDDYDHVNGNTMIEGLGGNYFFWEVAVLAFYDLVSLECVVVDSVSVYGSSCGTATSVDAGLDGLDIQWHGMSNILRIPALPEAGRLQVIDVQGRALLEQSIDLSGADVKLTGWTPGVYYYQLEAGGGYATGKILVY